MLSPVIFDTILNNSHFQPVLFRRRKPVALDHRSGAAHPPVALQVVYWCMRCNDISAAVRVMEHGRRLQMRSSWDKLLQLAHIVAGEDVAQYAQAVRAAQEEYWSHGSAMDDYLRVVYSVLAAPDPMLDLHGEDGLLPSRHVTNEDYLWHRLSVRPRTSPHLVSPLIAPSPLISPHLSSHPQITSTTSTRLASPRRAAPRLASPRLVLGLHVS